MTKQVWYRSLWFRLIITTLMLLFIAFCVGLIFWGSHPSSTDIALALLAGISAFVAVGQWFFPRSDKPDRLQLLRARELIHKRGSFRMGDSPAANFKYIKEPIKEAYEKAEQVLQDVSIGTGPKRGMLILGIANAGKTRLAFEAITQTLPNWKVLLWRADDRLSEIPVPTVSNHSGLVVFIDNLQEFVPPEVYYSNGLVYIPDNRVQTLEAFLDNIQTTENWVVVVTCRLEDKSLLEDETRVGARLRSFFFEQLEVIYLPRFRPETTDPESAKIINLFQQQDAPHVKDWDGTLGSLVLGLLRKQSLYEG